MAREVKPFGYESTGHFPDTPEGDLAWYHTNNGSLSENLKRKWAARGLPVPEPEVRPTQYLSSWSEILDVLEIRGNNDTNRKRVRSLNEHYNGPIVFGGQRSSPIVSKRLLLDWWNGLEAQLEDQRN